MRSAIEKFSLMKDAQYAAKARQDYAKKLTAEEDLKRDKKYDEVAAEIFAKFENRVNQPDYFGGVVLITENMFDILYDRTKIEVVEDVLIIVKKLKVMVGTGITVGYKLVPVSRCEFGFM